MLRPRKANARMTNHRHEATDLSTAGKEGDLGIMGVLIHVAGDAANNVGVIIAGAVIWKISSPDRYCADRAVSMAIAFMIFFSPISRRRRVRQSELLRWSKH